MPEYTEELSSDSIGAMIQAVEAQSEAGIPWSFAMACQSSPTGAEATTVSAEPLSKEEIRRAQREDKDTGLPIDVFFGIDTSDSPTNKGGYLETWKRGMQEAQEIAREHMKKASDPTPRSKSKRRQSQENSSVPKSRTEESELESESDSEYYIPVEPYQFRKQSSNYDQRREEALTRPPTPESPASEYTSDNLEREQDAQTPSPVPVEENKPELFGRRIENEPASALENLGTKEPEEIELSDGPVEVQGENQKSGDNDDPQRSSRMTT
ncbi:hypothetical protein DPEC_G00278250 [Dallia pectoralis]|uniref:Uncharacterized protein n=1 Tax=Dallia pectoralis TaxID=75939 RepID=A0ACC2FM27_DALPE|nr:hypothetical protein DPEC_G00278250 [Dallia pectoralis]